MRYLNSKLFLFHLDSDCENKLFSSFKYYLAFENRNCTDYITEKLWKSFEENIIPIVLQPSRESYSHFSIPKNSIIHMQGFKAIWNDFLIVIKKGTFFIHKSA